MKRPRVVIKRDDSPEFKARLKALASKRVSVGVLGEAAAKQAPKAKVTIGQIAHVHEFGRTILREDGTQIVIPMRSFIRAPLDRMRPEISKALAAGARAVLEGKVAQETMFEGLGMFVAGRIKTAIAQGLPVPPLKPATIKRKKSSTPLIDRGQLRGSIAPVVRDKT